MKGHYERLSEEHWTRGIISECCAERRRCLCFYLCYSSERHGAVYLALPVTFRVANSLTDSIDGFHIDSRIEFLVPGFLVYVTCMVLV